AQYNVGACYQFAKGVSEDWEQAALWYKKAADQKFRSAEIALGTLQELRATKKEIENQFKKTVDQEAAQVKLQVPYRMKFDALMALVTRDMPRYEELKRQWLEVKGKELQVKVFSRIKVLQDSVEKGDMITPQILKEMEELSKSFSTALADAKKVIAKAHEKVARKAYQQERRASMRLDQAPVFAEIPKIEEPSVSETRLIKERLAQEAEAKEKRRSVTLERRLSRSLSRNSLKLDFQQTQEQLAKEKEKHELRKSQRLSKLYTKEELIAAGLLPADNGAEPVKIYGRIASFEKGTQEIYEGKREAREYTALVRDLLQSFADSADLKLFKKVHKFEKLKKGLGGLVGVDHLKPWERNGCRICSFRISDSIPERIVFAWKKKEQKAYQVTFVNYHPK
nr:SEL1-like repeat protein [Alphaproteobacteria bacterium]